MNLLRNKEIQILLAVLLIIAGIGVVSCFVISNYAGIIILITTFCLIFSFFIFTKLRYSHIEELSDYLKQVSSGNYTLDIRNNSEGELSILKNEIYKVTVMLSEQAELLKKEKVQLSDSISDISHQLKTPLTSMFIMTELLSNENLPTDKRIEFTAKIRLQLERLQWLVTSLLKLSRFDVDAVILNKSTIFIKCIVENAVEPLLIPMEIKEQELIVEGSETDNIECDLNWTIEAIVNILKNCVEHTPVGGKIHISFLENPLYSEILIKDTGCGISKKDIPHIFERFYKGQNACEESVGIGLAMAKSIIQKQNGNITATSELGIGTSFSIRIYKENS